MMNPQTNKITDDDVLDIFYEKLNKPITSSICNKCNICGSKNIIYTCNRSSKVCEDCGSESEHMLDESPEWNSYDDVNPTKGRCGGTTNIFFPKSSLSTVMNYRGFSKMKTLKNWSRMPYNERSLGKILNYIDEKCDSHKIPKIVKDEAKILYRNIKEIKNKGKSIIIRGENKEDIIAACLYFAAIIQKRPRSMNEIAEIFDLELKQLTKGCRKFLEIMKDNFIIFDMCPTQSSDLVTRHGIKLKLPNNIISLSKNISANIYKLGLLSEHQSISLAAASILLACDSINYIIDKKVIAKTFDISVVTLQKTFKKLEKYKKIICSNENTNDISNKIKQSEQNNISITENLTSSNIFDESDIIKQDNELIKKLKIEEHNLLKKQRKEKSQNKNKLNNSKNQLLSITST